MGVPHISRPHRRQPHLLHQDKPRASGLPPVLPGGAGGAGGQPQAGAFQQAASAQVSHPMVSVLGTGAVSELPSASLSGMWLLRLQAGLASLSPSSSPAVAHHSLLPWVSPDSQRLCSSPAVPCDGQPDAFASCLLVQSGPVAPPYLPSFGYPPNTQFSPRTSPLRHVAKRKYLTIVPDARIGLL